MTQCSIERLWNLDRICKRWKGPIAVGAFAKSTERPEEIESEVRKETSDCTPAAVGVIHAKHAGERYPVNALRNVAWALVNTTHVFVLDVDFWPSMDLHHILNLALRKMALRNAASTDPYAEAEALVVPSFHLRVNNSDHSPRSAPLDRDVATNLMPMNYPEMLRCLAAYIDDTRWKPGVSCAPFRHHGTTRFTDWCVTPGIFKLSCFISNSFEPFVVVPRFHDGIETPIFDPQFDGYGKNKLEWTAKLRASNFTFYVVPKGFVVHSIHVESNSFKAWKKTTKNRLKLDAIFQERVTELFANNTVKTPLCPNWHYLFRNFEHKRAWTKLSTLATVCDSEEFVVTKARGDFIRGREDDDNNALVMGRGSTRKAERKRRARRREYGRFRGTSWAQMVSATPISSAQGFRVLTENEGGDDNNAAKEDAPSTETTQNATVADMKNYVISPSLFTADKMEAGENFGPSYSSSSRCRLLAKSLSDLFELGLTTRIESVEEGEANGEKRNTW